jgi:HSP20 family protein
MQIKDLIPWGRKAESTSTVPQADNDHPVVSLQREMNRVFDSFWNRFDRPFGGAVDTGFWQGYPRADVSDTDNTVEVTVEVPGLDEKELEVSLAGDVLTVKGERKSEREEDRKGWYLSERSYGSFYRAIPLPPGVSTEDAKANLRNGVLTVSLLKTAEAQAKIKRIDVKAA